MRVYEAPRAAPTPDQVAQARTALENLRKERRNALTAGVLAVITGAAMITGSVYFITQNTPTTTAMAAFAAVGGVITLVLGLRLFFVLPDAEIIDDRATDTIVELDAVRITSAASIDDDANAIVLHDGDGGAVYINSHRLFELDENSERYPSAWRLRLTAREGRVVDWETSGPLVRVEDAGAGILRAPEWAEAVVLDAHTPERWRLLMPVASGA
jgi:hypothetical protein